MIKQNSESVIENETKSTELKWNKDKKYIVSCNNKDDNRDGFYYCNVALKEYHIKLGSAVKLEEPVFSHLTNAEILTVPGCNLKDESTYVDIEKNTYKTEIKKRFSVTEV